MRQFIPWFLVMFLLSLQVACGGSDASEEDNNSNSDADSDSDSDTDSDSDSDSDSDTDSDSDSDADSDSDTDTDTDSDSDTDTDTDSDPDTDTDTDTNSNGLSFEVTNEVDAEQKDVSVFVDIADIKEKAADFDADTFVVMDGDKELPSQTVEDDKIVFIADLEASETKTFEVKYGSEGNSNKNYPQRTNVELSVKDGNGWKDVNHLRAQDDNPTLADHQEYIRFEGPGWESDLVGYRLYLDHRNSTDIFGKKTDDIVLPDVGLDGYDSYHSDSTWGMDVLNVGEALGFGAIGSWNGSSPDKISSTEDTIADVIEDGPVFALLRMTYNGWNGTDLIADLSISAGSALTKTDISVDGSLSNVCTSLVKHDSSGALMTGSSGNWSYYGTWGNQSYTNDGLGTALFYPTDDLQETTEDNLNHVVVLKPNNGKVLYYFSAAWTLDVQGIKSRDAFEDFMKATAERLDKGVSVQIK